ncbi:uncharacterized protein [Dendropsophus ebraccatus]|uniref:uncharacterized protein n=1 Tax=Dendropsophus ebraccatus TaxID=150705 RepID=UPI00383135DB
MGAACAPSYANLFLGLWEREIFCTNPVENVEKVHLWLRFIDDVLFIWQGTEEELVRFVGNLNNNRKNIRLTLKYSREILNSWILKSIRILQESYKQIYIGKRPRQANELAERFEACGYNKRSIRRGLERARSARREDLLIPKRKKQHEPDSKVRFITPYNEKANEVRGILQRYWPVLKVDPVVGKWIPESPAITYKWAENLKDVLVRSYHKGVTVQNIFGTKGPKWGCYPCGTCVACPNMERAVDFRSSDGSQLFKITQHITCNTVGVIYYATCPCNLIYVGLTTRKLKIRVREHIHDIRRAMEEEDIQQLKPILRHFKAVHDENANLLKIAYNSSTVFCSSKGRYGVVSRINKTEVPTFGFCIPPAVFLDTILWGYQHPNKWKLVLIHHLYIIFFVIVSLRFAISNGTLSPTCDGEC